VDVRSQDPTREPLRPNAQALDLAARGLRARRPDVAERFAGAVLAADPDNLLAAQILGAARLMQGRAAEAIPPLQSAARRSTDPATETYLAKALALVGRRDEALGQLRTAISRRPPFSQAFLELGDQLGEAGRFDEAGQVFEAGLSLMPDAAVLRIGLGYLHMRRNDRTRARELFSEVRAAAPQRRDAVIALARVMVLDGEHAAATDLFRLALAAAPDDAVIQIELGKCLLDMGDRKAGEALLQAGGRRAAQRGTALKALAHGAHGRFFLRPSRAARFLREGTPA
jgi:predicted Zn-dependent protease